MKYLFMLVITFSLCAKDPQILNWYVDTNNIIMVSKVTTFDTVLSNSPQTVTYDTTTTIVWNGSVVYSCFDADNDSMGVFIYVNVGADTVPADSVWGITRAFTG